MEQKKSNTKILDIFNKYKESIREKQSIIDEAKKINQKVKKKSSKESNDKVIKELEKLLDKQKKEFEKVVAKLKIDTDDEGMIVNTKENLKKVEKTIGKSGGLIQFNYTIPLSPGSFFTNESPLDRHPLVVFIANIGTGSDGNQHFVGINIHHIDSKYRKKFWNWIVREYLIKYKNGRRKLEIPNTLYYILLDNPELKFAIRGYRRYSYGVAKNIISIKYADYEKIFTPPYKARFYQYSEKKGRLIPRTKS